MDYTAREWNGRKGKFSTVDLQDGGSKLEVVCVAQFASDT